MTIKTGIVYLQKDKFQFFSPYLGRILEFRFTPECVRDLDVINGSQVENLIRVFVANNKITPSNLIVVLAENAYFVKDFVMPAEQKTPGTPAQAVTKELLQKQADEFIEHVPFDDVVGKTIPLKNGVRVCATNKDFYGIVASSFEHLGFTIESILPGLVLGNGLSLRPVMDGTMANLILQRASSVKQYNLLGQQVFQPQIKQETEDIDEVEEERDKEQSSGKKTDKKRQYALVGVLAFLLVILIIVFVQSQMQPSPYQHKTPVNTSNPVQPASKQVIVPTAVPTVASVVTPSALITKNLTVKVINSPKTASIAKSLVNRLDTYKFKSVNMQTQGSVGSANTLVSFSPTTSQSVRDAVLSEVKKFKSTISVQDKQIGTYDITIVVGE